MKLPIGIAVIKTKPNDEMSSSSRAHVLDV